jgi:hypothetical protein
VKFYIKVANSKGGNKYHALCIERYGIEKAVSFDIEVLLLVSGLSMADLYGLPMGKHPVKI